MAKYYPVATLTLNPALDIDYRVKQLVPNEKIGAMEANYDPGGNGINVSRALKKLGLDATTYYIIAGESGDLLQTLLKNEIDHSAPVRVPGRTRINCTIQQRRPPEEYKVAGVGPEVPPEALEEITSAFLEGVHGGYGVLTGSLPAGVPADEYVSLSHQIAERGARVIADMQARVLAQVLDTNPYLIKPNHYELEVLSGKSLLTLNSLAEEARKLQQGGVEYVCVSLGGQGAILVNAENSYFVAPPKIKVICTTGAGDATLGGLISGLLHGQSAEETLRMAVACGTLTAAESGTGLFKTELLEETMADMEVHAMDI